MSYWYLATPYSKYPGGIDQAFRDACLETALLLKAGVPVFCPIAHTHPVAIHGQLDPFDHAIWMPVDKPMMEAAKGIIICKMEWWEQSRGVKAERDYFLAAGKPIIYMQPGIVPEEMKALCG